MAYVDLIPGSVSSVQYLGNAGQMSIVARDSTGAPVDVSGWHSLTLVLGFPGGNPENDDHTVDITGKVSFTTPVNLLKLAAADLSMMVQPGTIPFRIDGVPVTADDTQTIATGQLSMKGYNG